MVQRAQQRQRNTGGGREFSVTYASVASLPEDRSDQRRTYERAWRRERALGRCGMCQGCPGEGRLPRVGRQRWAPLFGPLTCFLNHNFWATRMLIQEFSYIIYFSTDDHPAVIFAGMLSYLSVSESLCSSHSYRTGVNKISNKICLNLYNVR